MIIFPKNSGCFSYYRAVLGICLFFSITASLAATPPDSPTIVIKGVSLVDVTEGVIKPNMTVVVSGDEIVAVGRSGEVSLPSEAKFLDAKGKYLIPGLWDMHVHISFTGQEILPLFLANGITSVRDLGGELETLLETRDQLAAGILTGPRLKTAGAVLENKEFLGRLEGMAAQLPAAIGDYMKAIVARRIGVSTPEEAREAVRALAKQNVDLIKFRTTASPEVLLAILAEAAKLGLPVTGHAPEKINFGEAASAGMTNLEHAFFFPSDQNISEEDWRSFAATFKENGTFLTPTVVAVYGQRLTSKEKWEALIQDTEAATDPRRRYLSATMITIWKILLSLDQFEQPLDWEAVHKFGIARLREMHRAGVRFLAGSDLPVQGLFPGFSLHEELELLVGEVGLSPLEALQSATTHPAQFFGLENGSGAITVGAAADLVLLEANPLEDISNTRRISAVVARGKLYDREMLDQLLESVAARATSP